MRKDEAPGSIGTLGTLNVVFGTLFSFCCLASLVRLAAGVSMLLGAHFEQEELQRFLETEVPMHQIIEWGTTFIGSVVFIIMLISGIGLVSKRAWARPLAVGNSIPLALFGLGMAVYNIGVEAPAIVRFLQGRGFGVDAMPPGFVWMLYIGISLVLVLVVFYAVVTMTALMSRRVRAYFERSAFGFDELEEDWPR